MQKACLLPSASSSYYNFKKFRCNQSTYALISWPLRRHWFGERGLWLFNSVLNVLLLFFCITSFYEHFTIFRRFPERITWMLSVVTTFTVQFNILMYILFYASSNLTQQANESILILIRIFNVHNSDIKERKEKFRDFLTQARCRNLELKNGFFSLNMKCFLTVSASDTFFLSFISDFLLLYRFFQALWLI